MKYIFLFIFLLNLSFYSFLLIKPLNSSIEFRIDKGEGLEKIFFNLEQKNVFFPKSLKLLFNIFGADKRIFPGKYKISDEDSLYEVFNKIYKGKIILKKFIIHEGSIVKNLFSKNILDKFCSERKVSKPCSLEGYLMPDVYFYNQENEKLQILNVSYSNQINNIDEAWNQRNELASNTTKYELLIIASILEKESCANERKKISGVIFNRLKKNMLLQMDSTTIYALKDFDGNLKKKDLKNSSLYNTYMHKGLPPGPISNPSRESLFSAGQPEAHEFLYFVAKDKCSHEFSTNYKDHAKAVKKFQTNK